MDWIQYQFIGFEWFWCSFCQPPHSLPLCRRIQFPRSTSMLVRNGSISLKSVNVGNERQYKHPFHFPFNRNKPTKTTQQTGRSPTACFQISADDITWGGGWMVKRLTVTYQPEADIGCSPAIPNT